MRTADKELSLVDRLEAARPFAADRSVAVRECAWDSFRPYIAADLIKGIGLLKSWVRDPDPNIRRCAVEATRPRGVWTAHIEELKQEPEPGLPLLEPLRSDPSDYVRRSVANWLNDASKSRPDWVRAVCARWTRESETSQTAWIVNHGASHTPQAGSCHGDGWGSVTQHVGIFGYPLGHSISPAMQQAAFDHYSLPVRYDLWPTPPHELDAAVRRLRDEDHLGANVTAPHKETVRAYLDDIDQWSLSVGAVNTIVRQGARLLGLNTDTYGFVKAPQRYEGIRASGQQGSAAGCGEEPPELWPSL